MKLPSEVPILLSTLVFSSTVLATLHRPTITPTPTTLLEPPTRPQVVEIGPHLEARQSVDELGTTIDEASQAAAVTTYYLESQIDATAATAVEVVFTQTFASVPDQWYTAGSGTIGYGTLTSTNKRKRHAETGTFIESDSFAQPVVLELQTVLIQQPLRRVTEIMVVEVVTVYPQTNGSASGMGNGSFLATSVGTRTASAFSRPVYATAP